jgi:thioredoxin 2
MITTCPSCGKGNRIPAAHLSDSGRCGACKSELPPSYEPIAATTGTFDEIVNAAKVPVLVDFWAEWCGPCKMIAPILDTIANDYKDKVRVVKLNIDENPKTPPKFNIRGIPTLLLFRDGTVTAQQVGAVSKAQLESFLETHLAAAART